MGFVLPSVALFFMSAVALIVARRRSEFYENNYHFSMERVLIAPPRF
jgi:hypothetical protein